MLIPTSLTSLTSPTSTLAAASAAMLVTTALAAYLPARRALRLDPVREINVE